jgi:hypothetical protein
VRCFSATRTSGFRYSVVERSRLVFPQPVLWVSLYNGSSVLSVARNTLTVSPTFVGALQILVRGAKERKNWMAKRGNRTSLNTLRLFSQKLVEQPEATRRAAHESQCDKCCRMLVRCEKFDASYSPPPVGEAERR